VAVVCSLATLASSARAIVGGQPVAPGSYPYVANVQINGSFGCTGTLIAPQWVLTAGHCGSLTGSLSQGLVPSHAAWPPSAYQVRLGSVYADGRGAEDRSVTSVLVDSDYLITNGTGNDVTLLRLNATSQFKPVTIAALSERQIWSPGALATIAGFGTTSQDSSTPPSQMQSARVPITTDDYCAHAYPSGLSLVTNDGSFEPRTMLCAGYPQGGTDTCQGDSGGPLLAPAPGGELRLVGATSFGAGCARAGKPGVYARLAAGPIRAFVARFVPEALAPEGSPPAEHAARPAPTVHPHRRAHRRPRRPAHPRARRHRHPYSTGPAHRHR
jgi:secreted trypsin-like serine protease